MSFPNEDLARLNESIVDSVYSNIGDDEYGDPNEFDLKALIVRLVAAEKLVMTFNDVDHGCDYSYCCSQFMLEWDKREKAWRKSRGEYK